MGASRNIFSKVKIACITLLLGVVVLCTGTARATTIDILLVYDTTATTWVSANGGMEAFSLDAVSRMNQAMQNSEVDLTFRLVHAMSASYTRSSSLSTDLSNLQRVSGNLAAVHAARDTYGADVVALLVDTGSAYGTVGRAYVLTSWKGQPDSAFTVNAIRSVAQSHTLTHEVGHNLGAEHSKNQTSSPGPNRYLDNQYSAGWYFTGTNNVKHHTIMAYNDDGHGNTYQSAPLFSTPLKNWEGTAAGHQTDGDNARLLRETKDIVANYRSPVTITQNLSVNSTSASSVPITANPSSYGGTTNYTKLNIPNGTQLILTAPATSGSALFTSWSGCDSTNYADRSCSVTMNADKSVTANYGEATDFQNAEILFNWMESLPQSVFTGAQGTQQQGGLIFRQYAHDVSLSTYQGNLHFTNSNGITVKLGSVQFWLPYAQTGAPSVQFAGSRFFARPDAQSSQQNVETLTNAQWITSFYVACWGRAGDPDGLAYWLGQVNQGAFDVPEVAENFALSAEAKAMYPYFNAPETATDAERTVFVQAVFLNLLNRNVPANDEGVVYWVGELRNSNTTPGAVIGNIIHAAIQLGGEDWLTIWNKIQVSEFFTQRFEAQNRFWQDSDLSLARQVMDGVTDDPATVDAGKAKVDGILP